MVQIFDIENDYKCITSIKLAGMVFSVIFSPSGNEIATSCSDFDVRIHDIQLGKEINIFKGHKDYVYFSSFNKDSTKLVSSSKDHKVKIWCIDSGLILLTLEGHKDNVMSV